MKIYAEWTLYGKFHNGLFDRWEDYFRATFNPDCEIKVVKEIKVKDGAADVGKIKVSQKGI